MHTATTTATLYYNVFLVTIFRYPIIKKLITRKVWLGKCYFEYTRKKKKTEKYLEFGMIKIIKLFQHSVCVCEESKFGENFFLLFI